MINTKYKLIKPFEIEEVFTNLDMNKENNVIVKPKYLSICKADLRYYLGDRTPSVLKDRLPLVLIHEACGTILYDKSMEFEKNSKVILLPNISDNSNKYLENYRLNSVFCSSRADGFMQEVVSLNKNQILPYKNIEDEIASFIEFITIGVHAVNSFLKFANEYRNKIAIFGDGALGYTVACILKYYLPNAYISVVGVSSSKLELFSFVDEVLTVDEIPNDFYFDHGFECVGGSKSGDAVNKIVDCINPEGTIILLGVSEKKVEINTRMILEKGISLVGRSRSSREDFIQTIDLLENNETLKQRFKKLISTIININCVDDIHRAFAISQGELFKTVLKWNL